VRVRGKDEALNRRRFLEVAGLSGAAGAALGSGVVVYGLERTDRFGTSGYSEEAGEGELVGRMEFLNEGRVEMDAAFGSELDGRLFTSLDNLDEKTLVTAAERFYLRTRASKIVADAKDWTVAVDGLATAKRALTIGELRAMEQPMGLQLMECAGNTRAAHFGMISVGDWSGVPLSELLRKLRPLPEATRVLVSGFDRYEGSSATSTPGASWIFTFEEMKQAGAFLALELDGKALSRDHGAPVRLVMPGWYGCTCIKWVERITFVDERAEATSQMGEYAARTHQQGSPRLAREFAAARIDAAAMPIRVEKWRTAGRVKYRVVGLLWGGTGTVGALGIRFNPEEEFVRVESLRVPQTTPWTL